MPTALTFTNVKIRWQSPREGERTQLRRHPQQGHTKDQAQRPHGPEARTPATPGSLHITPLRSRPQTGSQVSEPEAEAYSLGTHGLSALLCEARLPLCSQPGGQCQGSDEVPRDTDHREKGQEPWEQKALVQERLRALFTEPCFPGKTSYTASTGSGVTY